MTPFSGLPFFGPITNLLGGGPGESATIATMQGQAALQTARVGVAAAQFERRHGRLPQSLDELAPDFLPAVPHDPFADAPLRYRLTQTGAIIYSIGRHGEDHGGRELSDNGHRLYGSNATDITFTLGDAQRELWPQQWPGESGASDAAESR